MRRRPGQPFCSRVRGLLANAWRFSWEPRLWMVSWPWRGPHRRGGRARHSLQRLDDQPLDQLAVGNALHLCLLRNEAERCHARLRVDLEQVDARLPLLIVPPEIGARGTLAAEQ